MGSIKKFALSFVVIIFVFSSLSFSYGRIDEKKTTVGCYSKSKGGGSYSSGGGSSSEEPPPPMGYILIKVVNASSGSPVENANIYANGGLVSQTSEKGTAYFGAYQGDYYIKIEAPSFAPAFIKLRNLQDIMTYAEVKLIPIRFSTEFNAGVGGKIEDRAAGVRITLPSGGLRKEGTGEIYTGQAKIEIAYLDPDNPLHLFAFPGNFVGVQNGQKVLLETFGPIEVRIKTLAGEKLNLPQGATAVVEFPVPDKFQTPDVVPLWSFDENTGEWIYEGLLHKVENEDGKPVLRGYVSHFSWWNPDVPSDTTCVQGVLKDDKGNPISGAQVWSEGIDYPGADFTGYSRKTGPDGKFFVFVRKNGKARILASIGGKRAEITQVQTNNSYPSYYIKDWLSNPSSAWSVCPSLGDIQLGGYTIVLRWGKKKCDLDLHLTGPKLDSGRFHIATKRWGMRSFSPYAEILEDDSPEVLVLDPSVPGVYRLSVFHNNPNNTDCGRLLKDSGAVVQVWKNGRVIHTESPYSQSSGNLWKVLDFIVWSGGVTISSINEIISGDYCSPYHPDPSFESPCPSNASPFLQVDVPGEVECASTVFIPYVVSDPDGDLVDIKVYGGIESGEFYVMQDYIRWETPDCSVNDAVSLTITADDRRGGKVSQSYNIPLLPARGYKVWERVRKDSGFGKGFCDVEFDSMKNFYTILEKEFSASVLKISPSGNILLSRDFPKVGDIAIDSTGVYVAVDYGVGVYTLEKYSFDLSNLIWQVNMTTQGRRFFKVHADSNGVYVVFSNGSNYIIRKYSSSGSLLWQATQPTGGVASYCWDRCIVTDSSTGDIYISIYEDVAGFNDYFKIFRYSQSGSLLASRSGTAWAPVQIYPMGASVYTVRAWKVLEILNSSLNFILHSVNICSAFGLCSHDIESIRIKDGYIYGGGGRAIYNSNLEWIRDSLTLYKFDLGLNLVYSKDIGLSVDSNSEYLCNIEICKDCSTTYMYLVGTAYDVGWTLRFPFILKYRLY